MQVGIYFEILETPGNVEKIPINSTKKLHKMMRHVLLIFGSCNKNRLKSL